MQLTVAKNVRKDRQADGALSVPLSYTSAIVSYITASPRPLLFFQRRKTAISVRGDDVTNCSRDHRAISPVVAEWGVQQVLHI